MELVFLATAVKKLIDALKYATSLDVNAVVTQIVAWAAGVAITMLAAASQLGDHIVVTGQSLNDLSGWSQVLVGLGGASAASFGWDVIKSIDNTDSASVPPLLATPTTRAPRTPTDPTADPVSHQ